MNDRARKYLAERAQLERTGKRVPVGIHLDNTGMDCRESGRMTLIEDLWWHDCCYHCNDLADLHKDTP